MSVSLEISPNNLRIKETAKRLGIELRSEVLAETPLEEVLARFYAEIDALGELQKSPDVIGAYGQVYAELCAYATSLVTECEVTATVVYAYFAPIIRYARTALQSLQAVMPLQEFENFMRELGWKPDPIYVTTG